MMLKTTPERGLDKPRALKVLIPTELHLRLLAIKVLEGQQLSQTVTKALQEYFQARDMSTPHRPD